MADEFVQALRESVLNAVYDLKNAGVERNAVSIAYRNGQIQVLERLLILFEKLRKQGGDMSEEQARIEFGTLVDLNDIPRRERSDSVQKAVLEAAPSIPKGKAITVKAAKWGTFSNAVYKLRRDKMLSEDYRPVKAGDKFFLVRAKK